MLRTRMILRSRVQARLRVLSTTNCSSCPKPLHERVAVQQLSRNHSRKKKGKPGGTNVSACMSIFISQRARRFYALVCCTPHSAVGRQTPNTTRNDASLVPNQLAWNWQYTRYHPGMWTELICFPIYLRTGSTFFAFA